MKSRNMKRLIAALLCLMTLALCAAGLAEKAKVTGYMVRLRESASEKARVLDAYPKGTQIKVLKKEGDWSKVSVRGKTGYMQNSFISTGASSDGGSDSGSGKTRYVDTETGAPLHLRQEADKYSVSLGKYRPGTEVTVLKSGKYWSRVSVNGKEGYMGSNYLSATKP